MNVETNTGNQIYNGIAIGMGNKFLTISRVRPSDNFQKSANAFVSKKLPLGYNPTSAVNSLYSPKHLLAAYTDPSYVKFLAKVNPNVSKILNSLGLELQIYPENITKIINSHLTATNAIALQIANEMGISPSDKQVLEQACVFHDYGKILMPKEIINKTGELTSEERKIVDLHSELGYELLSSTKMNKRVLNLIKNHHSAQLHKDDKLNQILSVADIYSALREHRSYKKPLSDFESLKILDQKANDGDVSAEVVDALKKCISSSSCVA